MITMNWTPIGLNWTILFKCLEMTFVVIWRYINKTELNWIKSGITKNDWSYQNVWKLKFWVLKRRAQFWLTLGEHRPYRCDVYGPLQRCRNLEFTQPSELVQALPSLPHQGGDVGNPCQVLRYVHTEVHVVIHSHHRSPINPERSVMAPLLLPPDVHNHLLCLEDVQVQVLVFIPWWQCLHLLQIGCLPTFGDRAYHHERPHPRT